MAITLALQYRSGLTLTGQIYAPTATAVVESLALAEPDAAARPGYYTATVTSATGWHVAVITAGGVTVADGWVKLVSGETHLVGDPRDAQLDAAGLRAAVGLAAANLDTQLGGIASAAAIADAVLDEAMADHTAAGSLGKHLADMKVSTDKISAGRLSIVSPVTPGGDITLIKGSDYTVAANNTVPLPVSDPGEVLKDYLQDASIGSVIFGAGTDDDANTITGTIDADSITHSSGTTTLPLAIDSASLAAAAVSDAYDYHIKALTTATPALEIVKVEGCLSVRTERAQP